MIGFNQSVYEKTLDLFYRDKRDEKREICTS